MADRWPENGKPNPVMAGLLLFAMMFWGAALWWWIT